MAQSSSAAQTTFVSRRPAPVQAPVRVPIALAGKERYVGTELGPREMKMLQELIEYDGLQPIAKAIGISDVALLRACAGFVDRCQPKTRHALRKFFALGPADK
jgi:hypothetical protein